MFCLFVVWSNKESCRKYQQSNQAQKLHHLPHHVARRVPRYTLAMSIYGHLHSIHYTSCHNQDRPTLPSLHDYHHLLSSLSLSQIRVKMASEGINPLEESSITMPSDSEQYSGNDELSPSPPSSSISPPLILYTPPNLWGILRGVAINLLLPFVNGLMLGFGELFAHEAAFRLGWGGTKVCWIPIPRVAVAFFKLVFICCGRSEGNDKFGAMLMCLIRFFQILEVLTRLVLVLRFEMIR